MKQHVYVVFDNIKSKVLGVVMDNDKEFLIEKGYIMDGSEDVDVTFQSWWIIDNREI